MDLPEPEERQRARSESPERLLTDPEWHELEEEPIEEYNNDDYPNYVRRHLLGFDALCAIDEQEEEVDKLYNEGNQRLEELGQRIRNLNDQKNYDIHTDFMHDYWRHPQTLSNYYVCKNKAYLKMMEVLYHVVKFRVPWYDLNSFHLCEGPGYFIDAVYHTWRLVNKRTPDPKWNWGANTLNPYFENRSCFEKLIDDSHIRNHESRWFFGPSDDGDIFKFSEEYVNRMGINGKYDLVTADGSFNTQGQEGQIEDIVAPLIRAEVDAALLLLKPGGVLIIKMYRFKGQATENIMVLLAANFGSLWCYKPTASRPGSAEKYVVCFDFGKFSFFSHTRFKAADCVYTKQQIYRIERHLETFESKKMRYTTDEKEKYIKDRRYLMGDIDKEIASCMKHEFPYMVYPSRWRQMYGHDLIRRNTPENRATAIEWIVNTTNPLEPTYLRVHPIQVCDDLLRFNALWVTSNIPLEVKDSLFLEPIALQAVLEAEPRIYHDMFEFLSPVVQSEDSESWRRFLGEKVENSREGLGYMMVVEEGFTMDHFLAALEDGLKANITSFALRFPDKHVYTMLTLSRLSASITILMWIIFNDTKIGHTWICWQVKKPGITEKVLLILNRLRSELRTIPPGTSLRSFVPIWQFDEFHERLCWHNAMCLMANREPSN